MSAKRNALRLSDSAEVFAALGDTTRLQIVARLGAEGPLSISRLTEGTPLTRQAITKHLTSLADAHLVRDHWQGRERVWQLEAKRVEVARKYLDEVSMHWDNALDRLKNFVEDEA